MDPSTGTAPQKWLTAYALLLAGLVAAIGTSLYVNRTLLEIDGETTVSNLESAARFEAFDRLALLASSLAEPGNDVFRSQDVVAERRRLDAALEEFSAVQIRLIHGLDSASAAGRLAIGERDALVSDLNQIHEAASGVAAESQRVFEQFRDGDLRSASATMALMDNQARKLEAAISRVRDNLRKRQWTELEEHSAQMRTMDRPVLVLSAFALLGAVAVGFYGRQLGGLLTRALQAERSRKQHLETELEASRLQILRAERLASLGTLAAGVGHELNNIGAVFKSLLPVFRERADEGQAPSPDELDELGTVCDHVLLHGRQLLTMGRPGTEKDEELDLSGVVTSTLAMLKTAGRTKYVTVEVALPHSGLVLWVNRTRLEQVIVNVVGNAADALEKTVDRPRTIRISATQFDASGRVELRIADTGGGIPPAQLSRIFEPYYTTKAPGRGTGLGLSVVKQIIESYGGKLTVKSRVGEGTTFAFDLPLWTAQQPAAA